MKTETLKSVWQNQKAELVGLSLDEIRARSRKHRRKIRRRNAMEYVALATVVGFMGYVIWKFPDPMLRAAAGISILAAFYMCYHLWSHGAASMDQGLLSWRDYHRRELERQRDLLLNSWRWYLGPPIPGLILFALAGAISNPGHLQHPWRVVGAYSAVTAGVLWRVRAMHVRCARNLERQIEELSHEDDSHAGVDRSS